MKHAIHSSAALSAVNRALAAGLLAILFAAACGLGAYAAYAAMGAIFIGMCNPRTWFLLQDAWDNRAVKAFALAYGLIAISLVYRSSQGDQIELVLDFIPLILALPAAAIFSELKSARWLDALFALALAGTVVALGVAVYERFELGNSRPTGLENSPIHYAIIAVTLGFIALGGFIARPSWKRLAYLMGPLLGLTAALMTGTRAALPSFGILLVTVTSFVIIAWRPRLRVIVLGLALSALMAFTATSLLLNFEIGVQRSIFGLAGALEAMLGRVDSDHSMAYRLEQYRAFWPAFVDAPVFGQGWRNQLSAAYPHLSDFGRVGYDHEQWGYIHNEALSMTLGMGILGLLAYFTMFSAPFLGLTEIRDDPKFRERCFGVLMLVVGIFAGGLTDVLMMAELPKTMLVFLSLAFLTVAIPLRTSVASARSSTQSL